MPLYDAHLDTVEFVDLVPLKPCNAVDVSTKYGGIRSRLDMGIELTDIEGCTVGMLCTIGTNVYRDVVTLKGATNSGLIVEFNDEPGEYYTIAKSIVRLVKNY